MAQPGLSDDFNALWQRLAILWTDSEPIWNDAVRHDFDKRFMTPLQAESAATMKAMATLMEVIATAQRSVK